MLILAPSLVSLARKGGGGGGGGGGYASYLPVRLELNVLSFLARDGGSNPKGVNVNTHCLMIFADLDLFHVLLPYRFMGVLSQK